MNIDQTNKIASFVETSKNEKIGNVSCTYVSISASCPKTCQLRDNGCYAQLGNVGMHLRKLDNVAKETKASSMEAARQEAFLIRSSFKGKKIINGKPLRLHVSGDTTTRKAARMINSAVGSFKKRGGGATWSYTHAWRSVPRALWSNVSILASIDNPSEASLARANGYAPAMVVSEFPNGPKAFLESGTKYIPCPSQTKENVTCEKCTLCMRADFLYENNLGISFQSHGTQKSKINKRLLKVIP